MKQLIALTIISIAGFAQAQSSYDILIPTRIYLTADITKVRNITNPNFIPELGTSGQVVIDKKMKTISLNLQQQDFMDRTFSHIVFQNQVRLVSVTKDDSCKTVTYHGATEPSSLSRITDEVTVVDNTNNICETFRELAPTEIRLERTVNGIVLEVKTVDMAGSALTREVVQ